MENNKNLGFLRDFLNKLPADFSNRFFVGLALTCVVGYCIIVGGFLYFALTILIGVLALFEIDKMLEKIKMENVNFYNRYKINSIIYISVSMISLLLLRMQNDGKLICSWLFLTVWAFDSFSYIFGKKYGKNKSIFSVSPNKTIEGVFFGFLGSSCVSMLFYYIFSSLASMSEKDFFITTMIVITLAQAGDLNASWLKRKCEVKDSGSILGRHGGIIDRFDGISLVAIFLNIFIFFRSGKLF